MSRTVEKGYERALQQLRDCVTEAGFIASTTDDANYRRVWGRDGCVIALAALVTGEPDLIDSARRTLRTLAEHQGPHGEIPSNVDTRSGRISYGGTTGRVDANLWFVICAGQTWARTHDDELLHHLRSALDRVRFLLGAWEFNDRGLLYVPATGDWADEYVQNGYVLYDQLLYLQAQREYARLHEHLNGEPDVMMLERVDRLQRLIRANYWIAGEQEHDPQDVYHEVLYDRARSLREEHCGQHWMPFFTPTGYGYRFDAFANILASFLDVADDEQRRRVDSYLLDASDDTWLVPAFRPVITPRDEDWTDLQMNFTYRFKNEPHEYHNGGRWPMLTGWYAADLARRGRTQLARKYVEGVDRANALGDGSDHWSFPEFVHGTEGTAGGTQHLGWSAAGAVFGHRALQGEAILV